MNQLRARQEDRRVTEELKVVEDRKGKERWEAGAYCPRCGYELDLIAETAFQELWECKQCGYAKRVKQ